MLSYPSPLDSDENKSWLIHQPFSVIQHPHNLRKSLVKLNE